MHSSVLETIGSPLVQVKSPPGATVAAKIESKNPGGSAKDRPALAMVEAAERADEIEPGDHLVEPTSGNTGIGLSLVAAAKGYDITIVMPASKSAERQNLMRAYGADLELIEGEMTDAREVADRLEEEEGMVQLRQFENAANPASHYRTTAEEILQQIGDCTPDAFVAGVGTGGTLSGTARRLLEEFPDMEVVAVEPEDNAVLSRGEAGSDDFQGMGPGFVSENLDRDLIDSVETVGIDAAEEECRRLAREEGILVGQSSGGTNIVARRVAERLADESADCPPSPTEASTPPGIVMDGDDPTDPASDEFADCPLVLTVFWDSGERYMSTGMVDA
jgi:cysteine synthase A